MSKPAEKVLVAQQEAIWDYLDALLREIPEDLDEAPVAEAVIEPAPVVEALAVEEEIQEWELPEVEPTPAAVEEIETPPEPVVVAEVPAPAPAQAPAPEIPPAWSKPDFQALLFKVGSLTLAVPLVKLHSVIPWPDDGVTGMPNQPGWCFGLLRYRERNVQVVDTGTLVIPADKRAAETIESKHILILGDGRFGLACSAIGQVVKLNPEEVKWRSDQGKRPWLAGTVLAHLCALLDTEAVAEMLREFAPAK